MLFRKPRTAINGGKQGSGVKGGAKVAVKCKIECSSAPYGWWGLLKMAVVMLGAARLNISIGLMPRFRCPGWRSGPGGLECGLQGSRAAHRVTWSATARESDLNHRTLECEPARPTQFNSIQSNPFHSIHPFLPPPIKYGELNSTYCVRSKW